MMKKIFKKIIFSGIFFAIVFAVFFALPSNRAEAAANLFTGATNNYWDEPTNWSQGTIPTASDGNVATFDATSPNCTVNTQNRVANAIDFTGYTNTITMTYGITVSGNITLEGTMNIAGTGGLTANTTATLTSDAKTWPNAFTFAGTSQTYTLADDWDIDGNILLSGTTGLTINGNKIYAGASLGTNTICAPGGTTVFEMNGTGNWTNTVATYPTYSVTFNTAGTIAIAGTAHRHNGQITYTAGTVNHTGNLYMGTTGTKFNTNGMTWNVITSNTNISTVTLQSDLYVGGFNLANTTTNCNITGAFNMYVGGFTADSMTTGVISGTTTIVFNGTGTWSLASMTGVGTWNIATVINTAGTLTISGSIPTGNTLFSLTYTAGTVTVTGSTLKVGTCTLNLNGLTLNNLSIIQASSSIVTLASGLQIAGHFSNIDSASHMTIQSNVADTQRTLTLLPGATQDLNKVDATDIDSSAGQTIWSYNGVFDNATNWKDSSVAPTIAYVFIF